MPFVLSCVPSFPEAVSIRHLEAWIGRRRGNRGEKKNKVKLTKILCLYKFKFFCKWLLFPFKVWKLRFRMVKQRTQDHATSKGELEPMSKSEWLLRFMLFSHVFSSSLSPSLFTRAVTKSGSPSCPKVIIWIHRRGSEYILFCCIQPSVSVCKSQFEIWFLH